MGQIRRFVLWDQKWAPKSGCFTNLWSLQFILGLGDTKERWGSLGSPGTKREKKRHVFISGRFTLGLETNKKWWGSLGWPETNQLAGPVSRPGGPLEGVGKASRFDLGNENR